MSHFALPCIKCGKPLRNCDSDTDNQPSGGTEFRTLGHYGSTIHDEAMSFYEGTPKDECLELVVNICDTCILRAIDAGVIQSRSKEIVLSRHPITPESRAWVLAQNEKHYGSAWGEDEPVDYDEKMREAGWNPTEGEEHEETDRTSSNPGADRRESGGGPEREDAQGSVSGLLQEPGSEAGADNVLADVIDVVAKARLEREWEA